VYNGPNILVSRDQLIPQVPIISYAIFEIMSSKHIGVTILTFIGNVTSSVT